MPPPYVSEIRRIRGKVDRCRGVGIGWGDEILGHGGASPDGCTCRVLPRRRSSTPCSRRGHPRRDGCSAGFADSHTYCDPAPYRHANFDSHTHTCADRDSRSYTNPHTCADCNSDSYTKAVAHTDPGATYVAVNV